MDPTSDRMNKAEAIRVLESLFDPVNQIIVISEKSQEHAKIAIISGKYREYIKEITVSAFAARDAISRIINFVQSEPQLERRLGYVPIERGAELRHSLNAIGGFSELIIGQSFGPLDEPLCEQLRQILELARGLKEIENEAASPF